ncbi:MAG TPA: Gfo/Idh/MocA family oxidoreductase, partial [Pirellulales bacterium]
MKPLKLAVIGAGHLGRIHARLLKQMSDVEVIGVVDPVESARAAVASECGITAYADHHEVLEVAEGAVIATPTRHHHAVAIDFLRFGTPLLIEKPITESVGEANELVLLAERHGTLVQVGHIERFNPAFLAAADYIQRPRYVEAVRAAGFTGRSTDIGVVLDLMIHDIDLVLAMIGTPVVRVSALGFAVLGRHEDVAQVRLEFACGAVANLSASRVSYSATPKRQMQIWSERGFVSLDFANRTATAVSPSDAVRRHELDFNALEPTAKTACKERVATDILRVQPLEVAATNALAEELVDFVGSIRQNRQPRVTARQGRDA